MHEPKNYTNTNVTDRWNIEKNKWKNVSEKIAIMMTLPVMISA